MAFAPFLFTPLLVYPARGGLRFGAARSDIVSLPFSVDTLPIRIGASGFASGHSRFTAGRSPLSVTLCGL